MPVYTGDGRKVYLRQGRLTQTVNICTPGQGQGQYDKTYVVSGGQHNFVTAEEVAAFATVGGLEQWLRSRGATLRGNDDAPDDPVSPATEAADAKPLPHPPASGVIDTWPSEARSVVEAAIDELLLEFTRHPYLHRVEHSMHARLFSLLCDRPLFGQHVMMAGSRATTQVLHKEWPETMPRGDGRRGNFDLAVLSPSVISAASVEQFLEGRVVPCIAIEMGLDYDDGHLLADHAKLLHSRVQYPYLVHLTRDPAYLQREEEAVMQIQAAGAVRIGYAAAVGAQRRSKRVGAAAVVATQQ